PGDILVKGDRAAMACSLETRSPFLDVDLVEFVLSLPGRLRFGRGHLKPLLRQACADLWPDAIKNRPKQGFGAPIQSWLRRPAVQHLAQRVQRPGSPLSLLLPGVRSWWSRQTHPQAMWNLLVLGLWLEKPPTAAERLPLAS